MSSAPELDLSRRALLRDHLENVTDLLAELDQSLEKPVMCEVAPRDRSKLCERAGAEEHEAEWEFLFSCGEAGYCCDPCAARVLETTSRRPLNCPNHRIAVTVVAYEQLRR